MSLCSFGHVATTSDLLDTGLTKRRVARLVVDGAIIRVRRGTYVCPHLTALERRAVDARARLDCVSVLRENAIWAGHDDLDHFRVDPGARAPSTDHGATVVHWCGASEHDRVSVTVAHALRQAMSCLPPDDVVAALESALHLKTISVQEFGRLIADAPRRLDTVLREAEPGAQSGVETHVRLRLRRTGYHVQSQVFVPGVGHVDNLIDGVLALETDGRAFHADTFEEDRRRDLGAEWFGLRTLRVPATYVFDHWEWVSETVARMVHDGLAARGSSGGQR